MLYGQRMERVDARGAAASPPSAPTATAVHPPLADLGGLAPDNVIALQHAVGNAVLSRLVTGARLDRCACGGPAPADGECEECRAKRGGGRAAPVLLRLASPPSGSLLIDDNQPAGAGAMTRSAFMEALRERLTTVCDDELARVGRSTDQCPYLTGWLDHYGRQPAAVLEQTVVAYTGESPSDAGGLIDAVVKRVRGAVRVWATTGMITGIPTGLSLAPSMLPPGAPADAPPMPVATGEPALVDALRGTPAATAVTSGPAMQRARADVSRQPAPEPLTARGLRDDLGRGAPLDGGVRARLEGRFGQRFGDVRVHTGSAGARLADRLSASAVTVGRDIAFASDAYRPGTLAGDALIAHELAHTIQQRGSDLDTAAAAPEQRPLELDPDRGLEAEADLAAAGALGLTPTRAPRARRGLRLQGCNQKAKACPVGKQWYPTATMQWGSLGCTCIWKCLKAPPSGGESSGQAYTCPPDVSCDDPYKRVDEDYTKTGYGAAFTPLTGEPACGCFALDIEGQEQTAAPLVPVTIDMTTIVGPGADMAAAAKARRSGGSSPPQTDPHTGTRIPDHPPAPAAAVNPMRIKAIQEGIYSSSKMAPRLDKLFVEADPAMMTAMDRTLGMPAGQERTQRIQKLLDWSESRPGLPGKIEEGPLLGEGGTGKVYGVANRPDLASKQGAGRAGAEAAGMVELELAGVQTVYVGGGLTTKGESRLVLKRIDGVGSKDIIGRTGKPPEDAAAAAAGATLVTQRTIDDLHGIRQKLVDAKLNVGDFQFLVRRSDGAVFVNDPVDVTQNSSPSGKIDGIIQRFEAIYRRNQQPKP